LSRPGWMPEMNSRCKSRPKWPYSFCITANLDFSLFAEYFNTFLTSSLVSELRQMGLWQEMKKKREHLYNYLIGTLQQAFN
jgi:hypothetical protein